MYPTCRLSFHLLLIRVFKLCGHHVLTLDQKFVKKRMWCMKTNKVYSRVSFPSFVSFISYSPLFPHDITNSSFLRNLRSRKLSKSWSALTLATLITQGFILHILGHDIWVMNSRTIQLLLSSSKLLQIFPRSCRNRLRPFHCYRSSSHS